jgi:hypothetical protein
MLGEYQRAYTFMHSAGIYAAAVEPFQKALGAEHKVTFRLILTHDLFSQPE